MHQKLANLKSYGLYVILIFVGTTNYTKLFAEIINVPYDYTTIQEALNEANNYDTVFIEDGTYTENLILILNKNITIAGSSSNVIIDGSKSNRCLNVIGDTETVYNLVLNNLKLINGTTENDGGALKAVNISIELNNIVIENCYSSTKAGAIFFQGDEFLLTECRISNNSSKDCGGIYATGVIANISSTIIENNTSTDYWARGFERSGGAVLIFSNFDIQSTEFTGNESFYGGGLWCKGTGTISESSFNNNTCNAWMGAAFTIDGNATINNIEVNENNTNEDAVVVLYGACSIVNSIFANNHGAVFHSAGKMTIENCKLLNNEMAAITHPSNKPESDEIILKNTEIIYESTETNISDIVQPNYAIKRDENGKIVLDNCTVTGYDYCIYNTNNNLDELIQISITQSTITNSQYGIWNNNGNVNVTNSNLCYNDNAVVNKGSGSISISGSNIYSNGFAVLNENDSKLIDCKNNYWGHETGPLHPLFNTSGEGDMVNEYVDITPYFEQVNNIGILHPISIIDVVYISDGFEIQYFTYQNNLATIQIDCINKYSKEQYSYVFESNKQIILNDLPKGQYLIYASYKTTDGPLSNKSFFYDFKHFNGEKIIYVPEHYPTIKAALAEAEDGFTIYVANGTYKESIEYINYTKSVKLVGNPEHPESVIVDGEGQDEGCLWVRGSFTQNSGTISIDGFSFTNGNGYYCGALRFDYMTNVEIKNCKIYDNNNSQGAIRFHSCTNSYLNHILVHNNTGKYCGGVWSSRSTLNIDRSTIAYNENTYQSYGSDLYAEYCSIDVTNSIVWNTTNNELAVNEADILLKYCCFNSDLLNQSIKETNSIFQYPSFINKEENDYSLNYDSPCLNAGDPDHELSTDTVINIGYFNTKYESFDITTSTNPTNGGTVTGTGRYHYGSSLDLTATASTGYVFVNWTEEGSIVTTESTYTFTVNSDRTLVANFELQTFDISASANPTQGGIVTGEGNYQYGATAELTATPETGYDFVNWTEGESIVSTASTYSFTVNTARTLVANFELQTFDISASANPTQGGIVTGEGNYQYGATAELTATPETGYDFVNWTEGESIVSTASTYSFTVNTARTLVANFETVTFVFDQQNEMIKVYPNPVWDYLFIEYDRNNLRNIEIRVYSFTGNLIERVKNTDNINMTLYNAGIYFIEIHLDDVIHFERIIKY